VTPARALLIEIVNADQTPGRVSSVFPLLKGLLAGAGVDARWVRFGVATTNLLLHGRDEITLTDDDLTTLLRLLDEHRPDVLYATDELHERQRAAVEARVAAPCHWRVQATVPDVPGVPHYTGAGLLDAPGFAPDHGWEAGNAEAKRREIDNVYLMTCESCGHQRAVARNACYEGIDDRRLDDRRGCAFCSNWAESPNLRRRTPLAWVQKQVTALATTRRPENGPPNALLLSRLEDREILATVLDALLQTGLAARTQLLIAVRTDRAPDFDRFARAAFADPAASKLRIGVYASGIESFAAEDLARFNKETTPEDGLRAITLFRRLQADFPERFSYEGLTFILFTPWTTLETLHLNAGLLSFLRFTEIGNLFEARLRLHPDLPITALAERDGAVIAEELDPVLVSNRRKLFEREVPWRFLEPRLGPVARLALRFDLRAAELDDPLLAALEAQLATIGFPRRKEALLELLLALVDAARATPDVQDELGLLGRATTLWRARQTPPAPSPDAPFRIGTRHVGLDGLLEAVAPLVAGGAPPVASWTLPTGARPGSAARERLEQLGVQLRVVEGVPGSTRPTLLLARSATDAERTMALIAEARGEGAPAAAAIRELGRLHGVPACCAHAYSTDQDARVLGGTWAAWARRCETTGPVPPESNPLLIPALTFVPCRADCAAAAETYRAWGQALCPSLIEASPPRAFVAPLDAPDDGELVALRVTTADDEVWEYASIDESETSGALAAALRAGDRLTFRAGQVRVARSERTIELFTASLAVWSPERVAHPEAWRELARARAHLVRHSPSTASVTPRGERSRVAGELLARILRQFQQRFSGVSVKGEIDDSRAGELRVSLVLDGREVGLVLGPRGGGEPGWLTTEHFAISHRRETPVTSPAHRRMVHALCAALDRALARVAPHLLPGGR